MRGTYIQESQLYVMQLFSMKNKELHNQDIIFEYAVCARVELLSMDVFT